MSSESDVFSGKILCGWADCSFPKPLQWDWHIDRQIYHQAIHGLVNIPFVPWSIWVPSSLSLFSTFSWGTSSFGVTSATGLGVSRSSPGLRKTHGEIHSWPLHSWRTHRKNWWGFHGIISANMQWISSFTGIFKELLKPNLLFLFVICLKRIGTHWI